jgi:hypothetical protein
MPTGPLKAVGMGNSVIPPEVVIRPILPDCSVNQRAPSGPAAMPLGWLPSSGTGNSVTTPAVVIRPILLLSSSVNQRSPSGPAAMR